MLYDWWCCDQNWRVEGGLNFGVMYVVQINDYLFYVNDKFDGIQGYDVDDDYCVEQ